MGHNWGHIFYFLKNDAPNYMQAREGAFLKRKLTDAFVRALTTPGKHADGEVPGLYLEVSASRKIGNPPSKFWRLKYRLHGKENRFSIGTYPDIGLKEARDIARSARRDVANSIAPLKAKTAKIEAQRLNEQRTFAYVAEQWMAFKSAQLVSKSIAGFRGALRNHILPAVGSKPVSEIKLEHITTIITELRQQRLMAMARRVRTIIRSILGFAETWPDCGKWRSTRRYRPARRHPATAGGSCWGCGE